MSCSCRCGCDGKYGGGYQCYPLVVEISHQIDIDYTCEAYHWDHPSSPGVSLSETNTVNCMLVKSFTKKNDGIRTSKYFFALDADNVATVWFDVSPPRRGWHNKGYNEEDPDEAPFTKYDSSNPECSVKCNARHKSESDSCEFRFEASSNPNTDSHLGYQKEMYRSLVVEVSNGDVSIEFRRV